MPSVAATITVMDPRTLGKPKSQDGDRLRSWHFNVSVKGFVGALSPMPLKMTKISETGAL